MDTKTLLTSEKEHREQVISKIWDMEDSGKLYRPDLLAIDNRIEYHSALPCRVDYIVVCQLNWDAFRDIIAKPVAMRGHMGGGTSVCIPVNTGIKLEW